MTGTQTGLRKAIELRVTAHHHLIPAHGLKYAGAIAKHVINGLHCEQSSWTFKPVINWPRKNVFRVKGVWILAPAAGQNSWPTSGLAIDARRKTNSQRLGRKGFHGRTRFFDKVSQIAEADGHHPDLHLEGYRNLWIDCGPTRSAG